jgi:hypothetical protein
MTELPKVAVCFPSADMVHASFALSLAGLCQTLPPARTTIVNAKSSIVAMARNNAVERAQAFGADYVLFLDSDMTFPKDTLQRLLKHGKDIVGAVYTKRLPPYTLLGDALPAEHADEPPILAEMIRLPTGCMLIAMRVFAALPKPYFRFGIDGERGTILGEDYAFCDDVRKAGFAIWADLQLSLEIGHIGQQICRVPQLLLDEVRNNPTYRAK